MSIALTVLGTSGKMGKRILELARKDPEFVVVGALTRASDLDMSQCDVAIDFTSHEATPRHLEAAVEFNKPLVIGTTGHSPEGRKAIEEAAKSIPILFSPNFSFGIALCLEAATRFGSALLGSSTIDIIETHHVHKKDQPSGTAYAFANAVGGKAVIHSIRTGEVIGEHTIVFECGHERIELKHTTHSRDAFAHGALLGAKFLSRKPAGLYSLKDIFISG
jgi:4-hydroxy-tetrahydrodipicolinate reductase